MDLADDNIVDVEQKIFNIRLDWRYLIYKTKPIIIAFLLAVILTTIIGQFTPQDPRKNLVIAAKEDIAIGEKISEENTKIIKVCDDGIPSDALRLNNNNPEISQFFAKNQMLSTANISANTILSSSLAINDISQLLPDDKIGVLVKISNSGVKWSQGIHIDLLGKVSSSAFRDEFSSELKYTTDPYDQEQSDLKSKQNKNVSEYLARDCLILPTLENASNSLITNGTNSGSLLVAVSEKEAINLANFDGNITAVIRP